MFDSFEWFPELIVEILAREATVFSVKMMKNSIVKVQVRFFLSLFHVAAKIVFIQSKSS